MTLPSNTLSKEGYTFDGWTVKAAADFCGVGSLAASTNGDQYFSHGLDNNTDKCMVGSTTVDCSDSRLSDLDLFEWKTTFNYGTVKGVSSCNNITSSSGFDGRSVYHYYNDPRPATDMDSSSSGVQCWCRITEVNGNKCSASESLWVHDVDFKATMNLDATYCSRICSRSCAQFLSTEEAYRAAIFGAASN